MFHCASLSSSQEEEQKRRFEEESARLAADNEVLREQLATMSTSVTSMMQARSSKASAEKQQREALAAEADRRMREQVAATEAEKGRQVENLKAQSGYHLARKATEVETLRAEIERLRIKTDEEISGLKVSGKSEIRGNSGGFK